MKKRDLIRKNMVESVTNERNILAMANNPFVVRRVLVVGWVELAGGVGAGACHSWEAVKHSTLGGHKLGSALCSTQPPALSDNGAWSANHSHRRNSGCRCCCICRTLLAGVAAYPQAQQHELPLASSLPLPYPGALLLQLHLQGEPVHRHGVPEWGRLLQVNFPAGVDLLASAPCQLHAHVCSAMLPLTQQHSIPDCYTNTHPLPPPLATHPACFASLAPWRRRLQRTM